MLLAHEWLATTGGSENVFEATRAAFPGATAIALWNDDPLRHGRVEETRLARTPLRRHKALALPMMPLAWAQVDVSNYDMVLASSHAFAHHLAARAVRHGKAALAYIHTPARYVWTPELDRRGEGVARRLAARVLQIVDRRMVDERVRYVANSEFVRGRIAQHWGVDSTVIYPPVETSRIRDLLRAPLSNEAERVLTSLPESFVLGASRLVEYKRLDDAIRMAGALGLPAVIAGHGPDLARLQSVAADAGVPVVFLGRVTDQTLYWLYARSTIYCFTAVEDFGIMPAEAIAAGARLVVNTQGGAKESVLACAAGIATDDLSPRGLADAAERARTLAAAEAAVTAHRLFSLERFGQAMQAEVQSVTGGVQ
jgi:glycosyltransferase involved in cell wall biosynthesis